MRPTVTAATPFLERIRVALDCSHLKLALVTGMTLKDCEELCRSGPAVVVGDDDHAYESLLNYINERVGMCYAIREDLQRKLREDRAARLLRRERIREL